MPNQKNKNTVKSLDEKIAKAKAMFLADYRGLTHQQLESLRKALKKISAEFLVAKNTLLKISLNNKKEALNKDDLSKVTEELKNPTAALMIYGDEIAPVKALADFIKKNALPKIKIGLFSGKIATEADFNKLATLPTKEVLLATLAGRLNSPIQGLHYALNWNLQRFVTVLGNVKNKKS